MRRTVDGVCHVENWSEMEVYEWRSCEVVVETDLRKSMNCSQARRMSSVSVRFGGVGV